MIRKIINQTRVREWIDALPEKNPLIKLVRLLAKSILFRRRIIRFKKMVFPGLEDVVLRASWMVGAGSNEILVDTLFTTISPGTEKAYYMNQVNFRPEWPYVPGYSGCGRIIKVGKQASSFSRGRLVAGIFKHASKNILDSEQVIAVPEGVDPKAASFVTLGVISRCGFRSAAIKAGERVLVLGLGILGQLVIQMAVQSKAEQVIAMASSSAKTVLAHLSGAEVTVSLEAEGEILDSLPLADVVVDATGSLSGFMTALKYVRPGGRVVMLGSMPGVFHQSRWASEVVRKNLLVAGAHIRNLKAEGLSYQSEARIFLEDIAAQRVHLDHLIKDVISPLEAPGIYCRLTQGDRNIVGAIIDWHNFDPKIRAGESKSL